MSPLGAEPGARGARARRGDARPAEGAPPHLDRGVERASSSRRPRCGRTLRARRGRGPTSRPRS